MPQITTSRLINPFMLEKKQKQRSDIMVTLFTRLLGIAFRALRYSLAWGLHLRSALGILTTYELLKSYFVMFKGQKRSHSKENA